MTAAAPTSSLVAAPALQTVEVDPSVDLLRLLPGDAAVSWVRRGEGLVGWGELARLEVRGAHALEEAAAWWAEFVPTLAAEDLVDVPGSGPVLFAGVAFDPERDTSVFVVPEVVVGRQGGRAWVTAPAHSDLRELLRPRPPVPEAQSSRLRYADGTQDAASWCAAVAAVVRRIEAGELAKVVLARDLRVDADTILDPRQLLTRLAARFPDCWTFALDGLLGATPELLLRRTGRRLAARVLAGTAARGAGAEDQRLADALLGSAKDRAEHRLAVDSLADALRPHCSSLDVPGVPDLLTLANVRHLATDVTGIQHADGAGLLELVGQVHPTAAVGGAPADRAAAVIAELEVMERGRYAGPVGWLDARGDGEFGLALRCAELTGPSSARLFAGCGIVRGSDPAAELAETQAKFAAFQAALEG